MRRWEVVCDVIIVDCSLKNTQVKSDSTVNLSFEVKTIVGMALVWEWHLPHPFCRILKQLNIWNWTMTCLIFGIIKIKSTFTRKRKLYFCYVSTWFLLCVVTKMLAIWNTFQFSCNETTGDCSRCLCSVRWNFIYTDTDCNIFVCRISESSSWFAIGSMGINWFLSDSWVLFRVPKELNIVWSRVFFEANCSVLRFTSCVNKFPAEISSFTVEFTFTLRTNVG